jgi:glycosyltransferase involved in cell wall biosynthesis
MRPELKQLIADLGLNHRSFWLRCAGISMTSYLTSTFWYNHSGTFTADRGTPNVVLEASAVGVPVVATGVGRTPEIIVGGCNGYFVSAGDLALLDQPTLKLTEDEQRGTRDASSCKRNSRLWRRASTIPSCLWSYLERMIVPEARESGYTTRVPLKRPRQR